jgi:hypothetical protein
MNQVLVLSTEFSATRAMQALQVDMLLDGHITQRVMSFN